MTEDGNKFDMTRVNKIKDIGVIVDSDLKFDKHINSKMETANKVLGNNYKTFIFISKCRYSYTFIQSTGKKSL